ncbi:hypothetical protein Goari_025057 [Gossypium aridum]|uniref:WAT1-related protein n=1 Tax=Gossypium aridum TaxID=34290 RepID=A0A7J8X8Y1_GOSAI|nr:hypothetical protein [Gossypium aridum]
MNDTLGKEREMTRWNEPKELVVIPCIAIVAVDCSIVVGSILFKAASLKEISYFVFTAYSYILSTLVFLLLASLFKRKTVLPPLKFPLFSRIFLLGLLGIFIFFMFYDVYMFGKSSLMPFSFLFPPFFAHARFEKVTIRSSSSQSKIIGTLTSIFGALVIIFYKGPKLFSLSSSAIHQRPLGFMSSQSNWIIGGPLLAVAFVLVSLGYIIQVNTDSKLSKYINLIM